jgi:hypothetical protein
MHGRALPVNVSCPQRRQVLALVLGLGVLITLWRLGSTGVMDETPPLFAAAGRAMAETGEWLAAIRQTASCVLVDGAWLFLASP